RILDVPDQVIRHVRSLSLRLRCRRERGDAVVQHLPRLRQGSVAMTERIAGEKMARQAQSIPPRRWTGQVVAQQKGGKPQQLATPFSSRVIGDRPARTR